MIEANNTGLYVFHNPPLIVHKSDGLINMWQQNSLMAKAQTISHAMPSRC
jgi:hypothetical protein